MSNFPHPLFIRYPWMDDAKMRVLIANDPTGPHSLFRKMQENVQAAMHEQLATDDFPKVFLHGSPHIDNYTQTLSGVGMIHFDRAYVGPYAWDIVCFLLSLSLRQEEALDKPLAILALEKFQQGYIDGIDNNDYYESCPVIRDGAIKPWHECIEAYIQQRKNWILKSYKQQIPIDDPICNLLLQEYFASRHEKNDYQTVSIGFAKGDADADHFIYILMRGDNDYRLVDIKPTKDYLNPNTNYRSQYDNPYFHHGQRMIAASQLYAPGVTIEEGFATINSQHYWGRSVPTLNKKFKNMLAEDKAQSLAYAVGTQLGRAHSLSVIDLDIERLRNHAKEHFEQLTDCTHFLQQEIIKSTIYYQQLMIA